jgi:hypothetical protein
MSLLSREYLRSFFTKPFDDLLTAIKKGAESAAQNLKNDYYHELSSIPENSRQVFVESNVAPVFPGCKVTYLTESDNNINHTPSYVKISWA